MSAADRQGFECDQCGGYLPDIPSHGEHGAYCSNYCRNEAEPDNEPEGENQ